MTRCMRADYLAHHRAHDYSHLIARWRALAKRAGMKMQRVAAGAEFPIYTVRSPRLPRTGVIYISAGIHGDEAGATEGLVTWAERNVTILQKYPFFLVPCVNPWGLVNNSRTDSARRDLNRSFHRDDIADMTLLKQAINKYQYSLVLTLHEDYDAVGLYIYEIPGTEPYWGEKLLDAARRFIPPDQRPMIEGREAKNGMVRPVIDMNVFEEMGLPEAVYLRLRGCGRVFTIETPSEFGLERRVEAQIAVIRQSIRLGGKSSSSRRLG
jgi:murein peptide amidase A